MSTTRSTVRLALALVAALTLAASPASADGFAEALAGCWVEASGETLTLQPGESYMHAGEVGRWTASAENLTLRPGRNRSIEWSLSLEGGVLTLSSPVVTERGGGGRSGSPPDPSRRLVLRRADWSQCGVEPLFPMPELTEAPASFVPTPPSLLLTNRLRNDPVEVRLANPDAPVVCEIVEGVCQAVPADAIVFDETAAGLLPSELGGTARVRIWRVGPSAAEGGAVTGLDGAPCIAGESSTCEASSGHLVLLTSPAGDAVTGFVVLGSERDPSYERAMISTAAGGTPPLLWIEAARRHRGQGELVWTAYRVVLTEINDAGDIGPQMQTVAGPFQTGALASEMPRRLDDGRRQRCDRVARSEPQFEPSDGAVSLITAVSLDPLGGRRLELVWNDAVGHFEAVTAAPGAAVEAESVCHDPEVVD